tara:strand:+ start:2849 stop:3241 length:393 start_codon:yes stop_codon:yes gene_type:complete
MPDSITDDELNSGLTVKSKLEEALAYSNVLKTFNINREQTIAKIENLLTYNLNGGTFYIDQSLIAFVNYIVTSEKKHAVILDRNNLPIHIKDIPAFLTKISEIYFSAMNEYYKEYEQLRSSHKIELALEI